MHHRNSAPQLALLRLPHASLSLYHGSCWPSSHRCRACTAVACSPREASPPDCCCHRARGHRLRPITGGCTDARPLSSSTATAQLGSHYGVLCSPDCHVLLKAHVTSVCFECFRCFRGTLQVFQIDVAKIDRYVTYVIMVVHVCC
jgi:hypothetical protein